MRAYQNPSNDCDGRSWIVDRWPRLNSGPRLIWRRTEERKYFQYIGDVVVGETPTHYTRCSMEQPAFEEKGGSCMSSGRRCRWFKD